jgi:hypothetical protein
MNHLGQGLQEAGCDDLPRFLRRDAAFRAQETVNT